MEPTSPSVALWNKRPVIVAEYLIACAMILVGLAAGYLDNRLVLAARLSCDAAAEPGDLFGFWWIYPATRLILGTAASVGPFLAVRVLGRILAVERSATGRRILNLVAVLAGVATLIAMVLVDFAHQATPAGYPGDSGLCPPSNVPPWWPSWLPA
jgi:hypothetical protein